jgi:solute carrier family 25 phosphate transporter 23/24/25/41
VTTLLGFGAASSTAGQLVAYPLQLVRTRLQATGMPGMPHYHGMWDCLQQVLRHDGVAGFYRGIAPNFVKSLPAITISYAVFETAKSRLENLCNRPQ